MRKGIDGLAMLVQGLLRPDPFSGHLFVFRGRKTAQIMPTCRPARLERSFDEN
jgi:transposase